MTYTYELPRLSAVVQQVKRKREFGSSVYQTSEHLPVIPYPLNIDYVH